MSRSYECDCSETGFEGDHCETDIPECASNPCQHGGRCVDQVKGYVCVCWPGKTTVVQRRDATELGSGGTTWDFMHQLEPGAGSVLLLLLLLLEPGLDWVHTDASKEPLCFSAEQAEPSQTPASVKPDHVTVCVGLVWVCETLA